MQIRTIVMAFLICTVVNSSSTLAYTEKTPSLSKWECCKTVIKKQLINGIAGLGIGAATGALMGLLIKTAKIKTKENIVLLSTITMAHFFASLSCIYSSYDISNYFYQKGYEESKEITLT